MGVVGHHLVIALLMREWQMIGSEDGYLFSCTVLWVLFALFQLTASRVKQKDGIQVKIEPVVSLPGKIDCQGEGTRSTCMGVRARSSLIDHSENLVLMMRIRPQL